MLPIFGEIKLFTENKGVSVIKLKQGLHRFHFNPSCLSKKMARFGDYKVVKKLGQGNFGVVFEAQKFGNKYAIKRIEIVQDHQQINKEVQSLSRLSHDNVVHFYESFIENNAVFVVMEYCNGGDLNSLLLSNQNISNGKLLEYIRQIGWGLAYLHQQNVIHRDIKPDNIMMCNTVAGVRVKLADFGLSRVWESFSYQLPYYHLNGSGGPLYYTAPEIFNENKVTIKSDIFSFGCLIMAIFSKTTVSWIAGKQLLAPYIQVGSTELQISSATDKQKEEFIARYVPLSSGTEAFRSLVLDMVQTKWRNRPNAEQVLSLLQ